LSLDIKDPEAHELARSLAAETGETMTRAVVEALRERLQRVRRRRKGRATVEELLEIGRRCAAGMSQPASSTDHDDLLYGERGLPR
jgi:antitoxin VapB